MNRARNERGPIATSYDDLQAIDLLAAAWSAGAQPSPSRRSALRTVLQSVEILLLCLEDLTGRAETELRSGNVAGASVKAAWCAGFHRLCTRLSFSASQAAAGLARAEAFPIPFADSPALGAYVRALRGLDEATAAFLDQHDGAARAAVASASSDAPLVRFLHDLSLSNHEGTTWESVFAQLTLPEAVSDYGAFVDADRLKAAFNSLCIEGDSYLAQFRCLHQIPELLSFEANEHLAAAIRHLRARDAGRTLHHVAAANDLLEGLVAAMATLADSLVLSDYHAIRVNLGVTSGSHSVSLRYHLGRDLYGHYGQELMNAFPAESPDDLWLALARESLRLRFLLRQWRQWHLHLPRSNLGADNTRSLAGSPDAVQTVSLMRDEANREDALAGLARLFGVTGGALSGPLAGHVQAPASMDRRLLALRGDITRSRFPDVQNRSGYFSDGPRFVLPPKRRA